MLCTRLSVRSGRKTEQLLKVSSLSSRGEWTWMLQRPRPSLRRAPSSPPSRPETASLLRSSPRAPSLPLTGKTFHRGGSASLLWTLCTPGCVYQRAGEDLFTAASPLGPRAPRIQDHAIFTPVSPTSSTTDVQTFIKGKQEIINCD